MIGSGLIGKATLAQAAAYLAIAVAPFAAERYASACESLPDLHIEVSTEFDIVPIRRDYTRADIAALAPQQHHDTGNDPLGFYTSAFTYTINILPDPDQTCPARIETRVTLRLQHRLIEIGQEAVENACVYDGALHHYRHLAEVDEQTVERFAAHATTLLSAASPTLRSIRPPGGDGVDSALRDQIRAVVDQALAPLHVARSDAQLAVKNSQELQQRVRSCSI